MSDMHGPHAELRFTVVVKRAATGETETFDMVGRIAQAEPQPETKEPDHGSNP
jgi:hypothetical protein